MKAAYQALLSDSRCADWLSTLEFEFLEYEPKTGDSGDANGVIKLEMGDAFSVLRVNCGGKAAV